MDWLKVMGRESREQDPLFYMLKDSMALAHRLLSNSYLFDWENLSFSTGNWQEDENNYYFEIPLPGVTKDQTSVNLDNNKLTIKASAKYKTYSSEKGKEKGKKEYHIVQQVPTDVDTDKIDAKLEDGVLTITLKKLAKGENAKAITIH